MEYAIISAGEGSRLANEGVKTPKPLVKLGGTTLLERLMNIFQRNGASSISVIINNENEEVKNYVGRLKLDVPFRLVIKSTPSSMHSFYELSRYLHSDKFCLTTVDTVFRETEFSQYIRAFAESDEIDGLMAVTSFIDDEKPLYVECADNGIISSFDDVDTGRCQYVSGGIYCLRSTVFAALERAINENQSRMRNFQRRLLAEGFSLKAFPFSKIIDIDHASDIVKAEEL
ncbi:MAG: NDP-sugar synthase [Prevotellaceae bacterium]|jgi:NDP-sugar pyrophosphorylase family protein|nr:NDP-sugar synthase [Prevotellaceae bacterium]